MDEATYAHIQSDTKDAVQTAVLTVLAEAAKPVRITRLHRSVKATGIDVSKGVVETAAGWLAANTGALIYDPAADHYYAATVDPEGLDDGEEGKLSAQLIAHIVHSYQIGRSTDGKAFIVAGDSHVVTVVNSKRFTEHITRMAWTELQTPANRTTVDEVTAVVSAMSYDEPPVDIWHRVAPFPGGGVVVDLGDPEEHVVIATAEGWVTSDVSPGPLFVRSELTGPMPVPEAGGSVEDLWTVIRVHKRRRDFVLGWLASAFMPKAPHLLLALVGEQGTSKSETLRAISLLVDPLTAPTRTLPREIRDLAVSLSASWLIAYDNVSWIPPDISDALCRAVTGDSWVTRSLFTDSEIASITYQRIICMDGIDLGVLRGDFLDRAVILTLEPIPDEERRTLFTWHSGALGVRDVFAEQQPRLFGVLLDALVGIIAGLEHVQASGLPRMADAALLLAAMDDTLGTDSVGEYLAAREENVALGVESDLVAMKVRDFAMRMNSSVRSRGTVNSDNGTSMWRGSASDLLENVCPTEIPRGWPTTAHHFSARLRRAAPGLRAVGIDIGFGREAHMRTITLRYDPNGDEPDPITEEPNVPT